MSPRVRQWTVMSEEDVLPEETETAETVQEVDTDETEPETNGDDADAVADDAPRVFTDPDSVT